MDKIRNTNPIGELNLSLRSSIKRIRRTQNQTVDLLARLALTCIRANKITFNGACSFAPHEQECPLMTTLQNITINFIMVLTASCLINYIGSLLKEQ